jgi:hypothetical protein
MEHLKDEDGDPVQIPVCIEKHKRVDEKFSVLEKWQEGINKRITATLIFTVGTLIGVVIELGIALLRSR